MGYAAIVKILEPQMYIQKLKIKNLKKYNGVHEFEFNSDVNILVGDNESGKSTLLEAIEMVLNNRLYNQGLSQSISTDLFNVACVNEFLSGDRSAESLPEILIEAFFGGVEDLETENKMRGTVHSEYPNEATGVQLRICFKGDWKESYGAFLRANPDLMTLPIEFYHVEWFNFAWKPVQYYDTHFRCVSIDPTRIHPTYGRQQYIKNTLGVLGMESLSALNLSFRQLKAKFAAEPPVKSINDGLDSADEITQKDLSVIADIATSNTWERNLQLALDNVRFEHIGKGEQTQVLLMLALTNKVKDVPFLLIEEPENHLSHLNMVKLINRIEDKSTGKQLFITTHSSFVLNKLNLNKVLVLGSNNKRLDKVDPQTAKRLRRMPGFDTLRVVLSERVILAEGPSDEIVLKKIYLSKHGVLPEEHGIDIIVVRGVGFKNYLNIATEIGNEVHIVKDNDHDYQKNIADWSREYAAHENFKFFSSRRNEENSLEPALIAANSENEGQLDMFARVVLSSQTMGSYNQNQSVDEKTSFLSNWFKDSGARKVDSAMRIFESEVQIRYPDYLKKAVAFDP